MVYFASLFPILKHHCVVMSLCVLREVYKPCILTPSVVVRCMLFIEDIELPNVITHSVPMTHSGVGASERNTDMTVPSAAVSSGYILFAYARPKKTQCRLCQH